MTLDNVLTRFSDRVDDYIKHRPGYPSELIGTLTDRCGLSPSHVVADVGSGPGNLARLFLENGNEVFGVEPNEEMRNAGRRLLAHFERYQSIEGRAEETHLPEASVDFITAGQAFHWFDWPRAKAEFQRILRPSGWVVVVWNDRRFESPFERDYEQLLNDFGTDYAEVKKRGGAAVANIHDFFSGRFQTAKLSNYQPLDVVGLRGRLLSASYAPKANHPAHSAMLQRLQHIFRKHEQNGKVTLEYDTNMYFGQLT
jgi:SAM-dependent methyltransferase